MARESLIKRLLPHSLLGRSLLIIVTPLVLLQVVSGIVFFESHWDKVSLRMARSVAGDIAALVALIREYPETGDRDRILWLAGDPMQVVVRLKEGENLPNTAPVTSDMMEEMLIRAMREYVGKPFQIDAHTMDREVIISVQLAEGIL
ncbi:MAG: two-component sensor histidine kinase, partial [Candidatus Brocadiia bacterium]|nr:two-component sensor histidine kinase [Candidatus Brocadiia bacterium]